MIRWGGRIALVTGASSGIGAAICKELVKHGLTVMGCARNVDRIEALAQDPFVKSQTGRLHAWQCDMSKEDEILKMHDEIKFRYGRLDVCVNNAITSINSSLIYGKTEDWRYMLEVGILGSCINTRQSLQLMLETGMHDAHIIQMGSVVGHKLPAFQKVPENTQPPWFHIYNGMKAMNLSLVEGLRQELRSRGALIRVSTISPGAVETELMERSLNTEFARAFFKAFRCLKPEDIAQAVTYILSTPDYMNIHDIIMEPLDFQIM